MKNHCEMRWAALRSRGRGLAALALASGWICVMALPGVAQSASKPQPSQHAAAAAGPSGSAAPIADPDQQIETECAELFKMAVGLKAEVDKTTKDMLSVAVMRKAGDIEQLARKVRDEIKPRVKKN